MNLLLLYRGKIHYGKLVIVLYGVVPPQGGPGPGPGPEGLCSGD